MKKNKSQATKDDNKAAKNAGKSKRQMIVVCRERLIGVMFQPICKILVLIGIATILLAVATLWQYRASTVRTETTVATIIEVNKVIGAGKDSNGEDIQKCRIGYRFAIDGNEYTEALGYYGEPNSDKCQLSVNDTIEVKYEPSHPANNAYAADDTEEAHGTLNDALIDAGSIAVIGIIPIVLGLVGLRMAKERRVCKEVKA